MLRSSLSFSLLLLATLTAAFCGLPRGSSSLIAASPEHPGAAIFQKHCAECHGDKGQGVDGKYDEPLTGELSLESLARKIDRTMPEDNEDAIGWEESQQVAAYIYEAFYSPAAQLRVNPPSKDVSRLTIPQHRLSVMDVVGHFQPEDGKFSTRPAQGAPRHGLRAIYRGVALPKPGEKPVDTTPKRGIKMKQPNHKNERVEERVAFHFGSASPDPATMEAEQFHNRWEGSIVAEETGVYEFSLKTENGARLWINDEDEADALIDAWVSSGPEVREEKRSIYLLGGRAYRLVLEHFKFKEKSASIELWWKPPHGVKEIIPPHALRPERVPERMIVSTSFPADDSSVGYARGTTISKAWQQAVVEAATATAEHVVANLDRLSGSKPGTPERMEKLRSFAREFVATAFRRPLSEEQVQSHVEAHFKSAKTPEQAVKRVVILALCSPRFLYPELPVRAKPDDYDIAARLALALWDSIPDKELLKAAAAGALHTPDQVRAQAQRMITNERTKAKLNGFFHHWLEFERAETASKDPKAFPEFNEQVLADLRQSLLRFVNDVVWSGSSDYRELLRADYLLLNERLGKLYGKPVSGSEFQRVAFDPKQRAGIVTHPYLLASQAYSRQSSPVHRGVFLTRNIVGMSLKPPPMAVAFEDSKFNPNLTMREKVTQLTRNNACMSCHAVINPLGFSLENFDAIGRWRTKDNNKPVNTVGEFENEQGKKVRLTGPRDIVNYVADNPSGHRAFIRHLFHHLVKQQTLAYGPRVLDDLQRTFAANGCHIQKLLVEIALVAALDGVVPSSNVAKQ